MTYIQLHHVHVILRLAQDAVFSCKPHVRSLQCRLWTKGLRGKVWFIAWLSGLIYRKKC